jgi:hypothetical protein
VYGAQCELEPNKMAGKHDGGVGGEGIDAEYAAAAISDGLDGAVKLTDAPAALGVNTAMHGELKPTTGTPNQPHQQEHCRYTKAGVSGSVCHAKAVRGQGYCPRHTCERTGCTNVKTSQAKLCDPCNNRGGIQGGGPPSNNGGGNAGVGESREERGQGVSVC